VDVPLPWERLLWSCRSLTFRRSRILLTDFRLVRLDRDRFAEIAIQDVAEVRRSQSRIDTLLGTSTLVVFHRDRRRASLTLPHVRRGMQLAALLDLLADDPSASIDPAAVNAALLWEPRTGSQPVRRAVLGLAAVTVILFAVGIGLHGSSTAITYPPDDAIYPNGRKQDAAVITQFMESTVMPWAREALGPVVGGAERVTCATCHGASAEARGWRMPGVAALPKPDLIGGGWEQYSSVMDTQMRNAIYGYLAEPDNQARAAYMREIVMPGMARLLHRPAYDFTRSYEHNRTRFAFGCYHCHQVR
jgi:mono/diheme cytochrome c family protein